MRTVALPPRFAAAMPMLVLLLCVLFFSHLTIPFLEVGLPLLPACAIIYYWALFRPAAVGLLALAIISLLHDALYALPLGSSLFLFLAILMGCGWMRRRLMFQQFMLAWGVFALIMLGSWLLLSFWQHWVNGMALQRWLGAYDLPCFLTWLSYPLFHLLLNRIYHLLPKEG